MAVQDILEDFEDYQQEQETLQPVRKATANIKNAGVNDILSDFEEYQRAPAAEQPPEQPAAPQDQPEEQGPSGWEKFGDIFTGSLRQTPETESLQEISAAPEMNALSWGAAKASFGTLFSGDEEATKDILKNNLNADFRKDEKGNLIAILPSGEYMVNAPGLSGQDVTRAGAQALAFLTPSKLATLPKSLLGKLGAGAAVGAGTEVAIQGIEHATGSEQDFRGKDIATAAALGSAGELIDPAIKAIKGIKRTPSGALETPEQTQELARRLASSRAGQQETGIQLLEPQATQIPSQQAAMRALGEIAPTSQKVAERLKVQNKQAHTAVENFLNIIADPEDIGRGATLVKEAAGEAIEQAKGVRARAASPIYNRAFEESPPINIDNVLSDIETRLVNFPPTGKIAGQLRKARGLITEAAEEGAEDVAGDIPVTKLQVLHGAQQELGDILENAPLEGLGGTAKRQITEVKKLLTDTLKEQAPIYREATEEFSRLSPAVKSLQDGVIGRLANVSEAQLKTVSNLLFDPQQSNPAVVKNAIEIINEVNPQAVPAILRTHLEQSLAKKPGLSDSVDVQDLQENVPGKLQNALFRTKKQRDMFEAAASPAAKRRAGYLNQMLSKAATGRAGGSDTAMKTEFIKQMRENAGTPLTEKIFNPRKTLVDWRKDVKFEKVANQLADALVDSSGKWSEDWRRLMTYRPRSKQAYKAMAQMLARISEDQNPEE